MTPFQRGELFECRLIDGEYQGLIPPVQERNIPVFSFLHSPELHHPLVSCLEASEGRRPNDLYPLSFLFRKVAEDGITWRGEWWRCGLRGT